MTSEACRITDAFYLAFVTWREARGEIHQGKVAVVHSVLNRVSHPNWWGNNVASVVCKPWQYSSVTAPGDPNLVLFPGQKPNDGWDECVDIALAVLDGKLPNPVPGADSYYAISMPKPPDWAVPELFKKKTGRDLIFVAQIGHHRFYNTDGDHPDNVKLGVDLT